MLVGRRKLAIFFIAFLLIVFVLTAFMFVILPTIMQLPHEEVCQLTGEGALNDTTAVNVYGADVGLMTTFQDRLHFIFGDTFGPDKWDWRSNTMAYTTDTNPSDGVMLSGWITDNVTHLAKELFSSQKVDNLEKTVIPTAAYSNEDCLYIYYMSVKHWGDAGDWTCNNASIAYSLDGHNFMKVTNISWPGTSHFIEWGLVKGDSTAPSTGGFLYFLATGTGRYDDCFLARVPENQILNQSSYQYFIGLSTSEVPLWSEFPTDAQAIIEAPMGEITVMWNNYLSRYILMNLDDVNKQILVRLAPSPWGPWSKPATILTRSEYRGFYAPNIDPVLTEDNGRLVYFTMSLWVEYNVYLMRVDLTRLMSFAYYFSPNIPHSSIIGFILVLFVFKFNWKVYSMI